MSLLDDLKRLFASSSLFADPNAKSAQGQDAKGRGKYGKGRRKWAGGVAGAPKLGQGGTLDPLADGALVIGVGNGTKHLQRYLDCTKEYRTIGLLGTATTSYDCCDPILTRKPYDHVSAQTIADLLPSFTGTVAQIPPLYSARRIDGKRLFEYARENIPLPRPIEAKNVRVEELRLVDWHEAGTHTYKEPEQEVPEEEKALVGRVLQIAGRKEGQPDTIKQSDDGAAIAAPAVWKKLPTASAKAIEDPSSQGPPAFTLEMTVSSGTYVRSIVHDLAVAAGSAAHVQKLTRTRQGEWSIDTTSTDAAAPVIKGNCIEWNVFAEAIADMQKSKTDPNYKIERDHEGLCAWERKLLQTIVPV